MREPRKMSNKTTFAEKGNACAADIKVVLNRFRCGGRKERGVVRIMSQVRVQSVEDLLGALRHWNHRVRAAAAILAGEMKLREAVGPLMERLRDKDWWVCYWAILALAEIGESRAIPLLLEMAWDGDEWIRHASYQAVRKLNAADSLLAQAEKRIKDTSSEKRLHVVRVLSEFGDPKGSDVLVQLLDDADLNVAGHAIIALGKIGTLNIIPSLLKFRSSEILSLIVAISGAAEKIFRKTPTEQLIDYARDSDAPFIDKCVSRLGLRGDPMAIKPIVELIAKQPDLAVEGYRAIGRIGTSASVNHLVAALENPRDCVRRIAAMALMRIGDSSAEVPLIRALRLEEEPWCQKAIIEALGVIGGKKAEKVLRKQAERMNVEQSEYPAVIKRALRQIFLKEFLNHLYLKTPILRIKLETTVRKALNVVSGDREWFCQFASDILRQIDGDKELLSLLQAGLVALLRDGTPEIRGCAAAFLGMTQTPSAVAPLLKALNMEKDIKARATIIEALGVLKHTDAVLPLLTALRDEDPRIRFAAVCALGDIGSSLAVEPLIGIIRDTMEKEPHGSGKENPREFEKFNLSGIFEDYYISGNHSDGILVAGLWALKRIAHPRTVDFLLEVLNRDGKDIVRKAAIKALAKTKTPKAIHTLLKILKNPLSDLREDAMWLLVEMRNPFGIKLTVDVFRRDRDYSLRESAALALKIYEPKEAIQPLIEYVRQEPEGTMAKEAIEILGEIGDPTAAEALFEAEMRVKDRDTTTPMEALGKIGDHRYVDAFLRHFPLYERKGLFALSQVKHPKALIGFRRALTYKDSEYRLTASLYLPFRHEPEVIEIFTDVLKDPCEEVRACAVLKLSGTPDLDRHGALMEALRDEYWKVRLFAAEGLARLGDPLGDLVLPFLEERFEEEWDDLERKSRDILATGVDY